MKGFVITLSTTLLLITLLCAQQLVTSRDSILIFPPNDVNAHYEGDTITVYNVGQEMLLIDSLHAKKEYSYLLHIYFKDSTIYYKVMWQTRNPLPLLHLEIPPADSALFVFEAPDLCPLCKRAGDSLKGNFVDSIYIYSNSLDQNVKILYATGIGLETALESAPIPPRTTFLFQNYPNPFNAVTRFSFYLPEATLVELDVFDLRGHKLESVFKGYLNSGRHDFFWKAANYASGLYFYRLITPKKVLSGKCLLIK